MGALLKEAIGVNMQEALRAGVLRLQQAKIESASLDARILLQHAVHINREELMGRPLASMTQAQMDHYKSLLEKRSQRQPVAQLIGKREFWGMDFRVTGDTLDPRPDSETLIEAVLAARPDRNAPIKILDLGTGTGCLILTLLKEYKNAVAVAVDRCAQALEVARGNAQALELEGRVQFVESNWCEKVQGVFDVVISNPPYIPSADIAGLETEVKKFEPMGALDGGVDGMDAYRAILSQIKKVLSPGGIAAFEIGFGQQQSLESLAKGAGMQLVSHRKDLSGVVRTLIFQSINTNPKDTQ
jgi:release factor glutamine methyltransferase